VTVKPAFLSQHLEELNPTWRVLEAVEQIAQRVELGKGRELTASQLCERLGFGADAQWTPVGDLSGGERRRLQLTRLLMGGPNVLVLDEPTNDFDVETLTALEDLLDSFAGTLLVVSHDRYFLERVCESFVGLLGDGKVLDLPGEVEQYLQLRRTKAAVTVAGRFDQGDAGSASQAGLSAADERQLRKDLSRLERSIGKADELIRGLHEALAEHASEFEKLVGLNADLATAIANKEDLEAQWLVIFEQLEA
jgi:ATP-binding cassette subfamily F protein uup